ncbi:uncharacterized protein FA14DRAFT_191473 [Meira miltonrushii]|uniref:Uncharacterized protein n=1 Tax=Meira miltonrushii TaxID=1280837 RepID=A0A316VAC5_9BASI|nr:uncharacterized protein FA14DRAFT_191473 [Meira miltonrushii]PWN34422.1 hypothetical protein FA14DRAFT_191473 [Meira miltonrushii]
MKRAITPYQPPNPDGQSPIPNLTQQTPVNQVIRTREPTERPPELPQAHPIQHQQPPPRYENERPSLWQRLRGNRGSNQDKGKGKMNEKEEEQELIKKTGKRKHPEAAANDHEAGTSGTKTPEEKKKKGFWTRVSESDGSIRFRYRIKAQCEREAKAGEALLSIVGAGAYGAYKGAEAVVKGVYNAGAAAGNKVKNGCNAACRAARNRATRLRERIIGIPSSRLTRQAYRHEMNLSNRQNFEMENRQLLRIQRERNRQQLIQNRAAHQPSHSTTRIRPRVVHRPQYSSSNLSTSSVGTTMTHDNSVSQHKYQATSSDSSSDASSASSGTVSRSRSTSSRRNPSHTSGRGRRGITPYQPPNPNGQSPMPNPNQQTTVNQAIRIREPTDRPPELPQAHPIQHNEPAPRYEQANVWQRLRGNRGNQIKLNEDKGKGKVNEKEEEQERSKLGKRKHPERGANDHEAGTSGTRLSEERKKKKGFWTKTSGRKTGDDRNYYRYRYGRSDSQRKRDAEAGNAVFTVIGAGIYGLYRGAEAAVERVYDAGAAAGNKIKDGCNAACRAARDRTARLRNRILGRHDERASHPARNHQSGDHQPRYRFDLNREPHPRHSDYRRLHHSFSSSSASYQSLHSWDFGYNNHFHPIHQQHSLSTHSASSYGAAVTDEGSVNQHTGHNRSIIYTHRQSSDSSSRSVHTSSSDTSSANQGSMSGSNNVSSRKSSSLQSLSNAPVLSKRAYPDSPTASDVSTDDDGRAQRVPAGARHNAGRQAFVRQRPRFRPYQSHHERYLPTARRNDRSVESTRRNDDHVAPAAKSNDYFALVAARRNERPTTAAEHSRHYAPPATQIHDAVVRKPRSRPQNVQVGERAKQQSEPTEQAALHPKTSSRLVKVFAGEKRLNLIKTIQNKRLADPMANDHEASTSGTATVPIPKKKRVTSNQRSERNSKRRKSSLDQDVKDGIVSGGVKIYNDAKKTLKEYCDTACQRARQKVAGLRDRLMGRRRPQPDSHSTAERRMAKRKGKQE